MLSLNIRRKGEEKNPKYATKRQPSQTLILSSWNNLWADICQYQANPQID